MWTDIPPCSTPKLNGFSLWLVQSSALHRLLDDYRKTEPHEQGKVNLQVWCQYIGRRCSRPHHQWWRTLLENSFHPRGTPGTPTVQAAGLVHATKLWLSLKPVFRVPCRKGRVVDTEVDGWRTGVDWSFCDGPAHHGYRQAWVAAVSTAVSIQLLTPMTSRSGQEQSFTDCSSQGMNEQNERSRPGAVVMERGLMNVLGQRRARVLRCRLTPETIFINQW